MKTVLMENAGIATQDTKNWAKSFDPDYMEFNTESREWMKGDDYSVIALLINPKLERIVTSSAFETPMSYRAHKYFCKEFGVDGCNFYQIEYYMFLIFKAMRIRERNKAPKLTVEVNYLYPDFLKDLKEEKMGEDTTTYLMLMLRQQDNVQVNIYNDYRLQYELKEEGDLKL